MGPSPVVWLAAALLLGDGSGPAAPVPGPATVPAPTPVLEPTPAPGPRRVDVLADFDDPRLVARVQGLAEAAVPLFVAATGHELPAHERLVLNLFGSIRRYRRAAAGVGVSGFMDVGAVTSWRTNESYLVVQPRREPELLELCGWLPDLLAQLVVHEAVHQFLARAGMVPTIVLPPWYVEGLADHLAERVLCEVLPPPERGWLLLDDARAQLARAVAEGRTIPLAQLFDLSAEQIDGLDDRALFYDQCRDVVAFLLSRREDRWSRALERWRDEMERHERPHDPSSVLQIGRHHRQRWVELVGDLEALERDWRASVEPASAPWSEVLGSSQYVGEDLLTSALSWQDHGYALAATPLPDEPRLFECELAFDGTPGSEAYVVLHAPRELDAGGLKLTLAHGRIALVAWRGQNTDTQAARSPALLEPAGFVPLRVEIDGRELTVRVGDDDPVRWTVPAGYPAPGGAWGLGAWRNAARWRALRVR